MDRCFFTLIGSLLLSCELSSSLMAQAKGDPRRMPESTQPTQVMPSVDSQINVRPPSGVEADKGYFDRGKSESQDLLGGKAVHSGSDLSAQEGVGAGVYLNPETYILNSGDVIQAMLLGDVVDQFTGVVTAEGALVIPRVGVFQASNRSLAQLKTEIVARLQKLFKNLSYSVTLVRPRTFKLFVLGEVVNPQLVSVTPLTPLSDIVQMAGGLKPDASRQRVRIKRGEKSIECDLQKFFRDGDLSQNPTALEGDTVIVPLRGEAVYIGGGVEYPGTYEIRDGLRTLYDLVQAARPMKTRISSSMAVILQRKDEEGQELISEIRLTDLEKRGGEILLQSSDIVRFPFVSRGLAPTESDKVYVSGEVRLPGGYAYSGHLTVQDYIGASGGLTNRANFARAQIVKKNGVSYSLNEQIRLEPGDTLYVPEVTFKFWQDHVSIIGTLLAIFATTISITQLSK